jgi:hypothetical protein
MILSYGMIGKLLGIQQGATVKREWMWWKDIKNERRDVGRHALLNDCQMTELMHYVRSRYEGHNPATIRDLIVFCRNRFDIAVPSNSMAHIIAHHPELECQWATPMDGQRMAVTDEQVIRYLMELHKLVTGVPAHFVFNMDEMGHQDAADAKPRKCVVPIGNQGKEINYAVSRQGKRITLIACVAADGSYLRPCVIIPRVTFENELGQAGWTPEKLEIYSQKHSYIDSDIFHDWCKDTLIPEVKARRIKYNYDGEAILLLDNCSPHRDQEAQDMCRDNKITFLFLPPHSSHQLQCLDVSLFGITKRHVSSYNRKDILNIQTSHIIKVVSSFVQAATPNNITGSFRNSGISLYSDDQLRIHCLITPLTVRRVDSAFVRCFRPPIEQLNLPDDELDYIRRACDLVFGAQGNSDEEDMS